MLQVGDAAGGSKNAWTSESSPFLVWAMPRKWSEFGPSFWRVDLLRIGGQLGSRYTYDILYIYIWYRMTRLNKHVNMIMMISHASIFMYDFVNFYMNMIKYDDNSKPPNCWANFPKSKPYRTIVFSEIGPKRNTSAIPVRKSRIPTHQSMGRFRNALNIAISYRVRVCNCNDLQ